MSVAVLLLVATCWAQEGAETELLEGSESQNYGYGYGTKVKGPPKTSPLHIPDFR